MSNNETENAQNTDGLTGYTDQVEGTEQTSGRLMGGMVLKFTNSASYVTRDEDDKTGLEAALVDIVRVANKWIGKKPVETLEMRPGQPFVDVEALNAAAPESEWTKDLNGNPRGPWQAQSLVYLIDLKTMDAFTLPLGTIGGAIACREISDKTRWMRRLRGQNVYPIVKLTNTFMNTRFGGRQRPHFQVVRWVQLGDGQRALPGPAPNPTPMIEATAEPPKTEPVPGMREVVEPSMSEHIGGDEIPFNDSPDPNVPKAPSPPVQRKPAASSKSTINRKGVTKIAAGGRGR